MRILTACLAALTLAAVSPNPSAAERPGKAAHKMMRARHMGSMMGPHAACPHSAMGAPASKPHGLHAMLFGKAEFILRHAEELDLADAQELEIKRIKDEAKKDMIRSSAEIEILEIDVLSELHKEKVDRKAVESLLDKKYAAKKEMAKKLASRFADLKEALSESQWKSLKKLKSRGAKP